MQKTPPCWSKLQVTMNKEFLWKKSVKTSESNWNVRKVKRYKLVYCGVLSWGEARIVLEVAGGGWWYGNTLVCDERGPNIGPSLVTTGLGLHTSQTPTFNIFLQTLSCYHHAAQITCSWYTSLLRWWELYLKI